MTTPSMPDEDLPADYEECGDCGFDHEYNYPEAAAWHTANPGSYSWEPRLPQIPPHHVPRDRGIDYLDW